MADKKREFRGELFKIWSSRYNRCIGPWKCANPAIQAHSVQRAGPLSLLEEDGMVVMPRQRQDLPNPPTMSFERVGLSKATTFSGLCAEHDASIFRPIESPTTTVSDAERYFLLAYRAILYEAHACNEVGAKMQGMYLKELEFGRSSQEEMSPGGAFATHRLLVAYETWCYKEQFDAALIRGDYGVMEHDVIVLRGTGPCVAVSTLFDLPEAPVDDDVARVALTVMPTPNGDTVAIFSYSRRDAAPARNALNDVLNASEANLSYELSLVILAQCGNLALSPRHLRKISDRRQARMLNLFTSTVLDARFRRAHRSIDLFSPDPSGASKHDQIGT